MRIDRVFLDITALDAVISAGHPSHPEAVNALEYLIDTDCELWITPCALAEVITHLTKRCGPEAGLEFSGWCNSNVNTVWIDAQIHARARSRFLESTNGRLTLSDWVTAIAASEMGAVIFTFNDSFAMQAVPAFPCFG